MLVIVQNNKRCTVQVTKIIEAQQAKIYNNHKNTRLKLLQTNQSFGLTKLCKTKQMTPKYFSNI